ncbi:MAG: N-acetylmuramoyl-L-alanine amidase family protein, partial [Acidimicrobiales bacterium]
TTTAPPTTTTVAAPPVTEPPAPAAPTVTEPPAPATAPPPTTAPATTAAAALPKVLVSPRGVVVPVVGREGDRYQVSTPCGKVALLGSGTPVDQATVVLDAGHGGAEPGAVGPTGLAERDVNLAVVDHARAALEAAGVRTVRTRTADYRMTLGARAKVATALHPKAFVSVHHNAEPDGPHAGPGSETYYQVASPDSRRLAGLVYEEVVRALSAYRLDWVGDTDAGAKYRRNDSGGDYYGILRLTSGVPATLAELAFVSNPAEAALISQADVQRVEGEAVARGILRFLRSADPGSGFTEPYPRTSPAGGGGGSSGCVDPSL